VKLIEKIEFFWKFARKVEFCLPDFKPNWRRWKPRPSGRMASTLWMRHDASHLYSKHCF